VEKISYFVANEYQISKLKVYAYFKTPSEMVSVEVNIEQQEVLIVVGTEQHSNNAANKLMFAGEAVRTIRTKYPNHPFIKVALFTDGYTEKQLSTISDSITSHNKKSIVIRVNTISDVINIINSGNKDSSNADKKSRRIEKIYAYSHGYVREKTNEGVIAFGYEGANASNQELDIKTFSKIDPNVFLSDNQSTFYSYACRTGIGTHSEDAIDPIKDKSLAQKMANQGRIIVYAYMRRSLYEDAWGTQTHRDTYASDNDAGDSGWEDFKTDMKDVFKSDPKDMESYNKYRKKEVKIDGAIWNPDGAYMDVKAGKWPIGVPATYDKYLPK
ncbi:MAG: hypothetical protein LBE36_08255, partial [Flavobacteriaceae bacterium]|nr:hypothetical protein [Flavobacteriaceae bacterium]